MNRGYSLIELMVTLVVVGILTSVGISSYSAYVADARRAAAQVGLLDAAHYMQRHYAAAHSFAGAVLPAGTDRSPREGSVQYQLRAQASEDGYGYLLTATPTGAMAGDRCGALTLSHTGVRGQTGGAQTADCWR
jgi:type IV pilus assembly protein PilE